MPKTKKKRPIRKVKTLRSKPVDEAMAMLKAHGVDVNSVDAWTLGYFPFTVGGNVWRPMQCKQPCTTPEDFGKGFYCCVINDGNDAIAVCEIISGAVVGKTEEQVRADIAACDDIKTMRDQIEEAVKSKAGTVTLTYEQFWDRLRRAQEKPDSED